MRLINETRVVELARDGGRTVEGRVAVRGVDALVGKRGLLVERHLPLGVVVRDDAGERELRFNNAGVGQRLLPYLSAPIAALIIERIARRKGKR